MLRPLRPIKVTLLAWPLIALVPFAGIRMICVEAPRAGSVAMATSGDCHEFCPRPTKQATAAGQQDTPVAPASPAGTGDTDETTCTLFADGSLIVLVSGVAMLPSAPPVQVSLAVLPFEADVQDSYLAPLLTRGSPPPKA